MFDVTDRHTQTPHDDIGSACIESCSKKELYKLYAVEIAFPFVCL